MAMILAAIIRPAQSAPPAHDAPDAPAGFGYKVSWFAIKTAEPQVVIRVLGLQEVRPANWASGIAAVYDRDGHADDHSLVFISPPVHGWTLVVGGGLPYPAGRKTGADVEIGARFATMFSALAAQFAEAQFFGSHRGVGYDAWARAKNGRVERVFCVVDGMVCANDGEQSLEERALKLLDLSGLSPEDATEAIFANAEQREREEDQLMASGLSRGDAQKALQLRQRDPLPDEDDTMAVAGLWSINPVELDALGLAPGVGFVAYRPSTMQQ